MLDFGQVGTGCQALALLDHDLEKVPLSWVNFNSAAQFHGSEFFQFSFRSNSEPINDLWDVSSENDRCHDIRQRKPQSLARIISFRVQVIYGDLPVVRL